VRTTEALDAESVSGALHVNYVRHLGLVEERGQARESLAANEAHLDHVAFSGDDVGGDQAVFQEVDKLDGLVGLGEGLVKRQLDGDEELRQRGVFVRGSCDRIRLRGRAEFNGLALWVVGMAPSLCRGNVRSRTFLWPQRRVAHNRGACMRLVVA